MDRKSSVLIKKKSLKKISCCYFSFWGIIFLTIALIFYPKNIQAEDDCSLTCAGIADDSARGECVDKKVSCLETKVKQKQDEGSTLAKEKEIIENNIALTQARIEQIKIEQKRTEKELEVLDDRIINSEIQRDKFLALLENQVTNFYKQIRHSPLDLFFEEGGFTAYVNKIQYEGDLQEEISRNALKLQTAKEQYQIMAEERIKLQDELKKQASSMTAQETRLKEQEAEKQRLISQTKNDEKTYQNLLNQARSEINAFSRFASSQGGGTCLGSSVSSDDGWFYSQRDPKWCSQYIGMSNMTIGEVGCLLSSVSMIWGKYGYSTTPSSIAANSSYFFASTAYMLTPPAPSGYSYRRIDRYDSGKIDEELGAGRPVIVHVRTNNGYGGHFIVLKSGSGGSYTMHDPWNGPDLNFGSYYSTGQIDSIRLFTK